MKVRLTETRQITIQVNREHSKFAEEFEKYFSGNMDELFGEVAEDPSYFGMFGSGELDWLMVVEGNPVLTDEVIEL